jgi:uncharacterized protein YdhG (YjbR/CyaY superfamily)
MAPPPKKVKAIDSYIKGFPPGVQALLQKVRSTIRKAAPGAGETITYRLPTLTLNGRNLVHFGAFKRHIGFYPTPSATEKYKKELSAYKGSKGAVQFPFDKPISYGLIAEITAFRVKETLKRVDSNKG